MISAWLTCAEAWLIALAKAPSFSAAVECSRRYEHAMDEVRDVLESNEKADHTIQALARRHRTRRLEIDGSSEVSAVWEWDGCCSRCHVVLHWEGPAPESKDEAMCHACEKADRSVW